MLIKKRVQMSLVKFQVIFMLFINLVTLALLIGIFSMTYCFAVLWLENCKNKIMLEKGRLRYSQPKG